MNAPTTFDTLAFVKKLSAAGMDSRQAEALAEAIGDVVFDTVATKSDLHDLELRLTIRFGTMLAAATALSVAILGVLVTIG